MYEKSLDVVDVTLLFFFFAKCVCRVLFFVLSLYLCLNLILNKNLSFFVFSLYLIVVFHICRKKKTNLLYLFFNIELEFFFILVNLLLFILEFPQIFHNFNSNCFGKLKFFS